MKHFEFVDQFKHMREISYIIYSVYIIFTYIVSNIFGSNCTYFCGLSSFNPYDLHRKLETHTLGRTTWGVKMGGEGRWKRDG